MSIHRVVGKAGGVRQDSVYDVDVKVVLLPNLLDVDIFMALFLDSSTCVLSCNTIQSVPVIMIFLYCFFLKIV